MDFEFETPTVPAFKGNSGRLIVLFDSRPVKLGAESEKAGRPIYQSVEFVTIKVPGSRDEFVTKVTDKIREEHREAYEKWKAKQAQVIQGTPLSSWPEMEPTLVSAYREYNILTIEHLAEVSDGALHKLPPGTVDWRRRAQAFLEFSRNAGQFVQVRTQLDEAKKENAELKERLKALEAVVAEISEKKTKKAA